MPIYEIVCRTCGQSGEVMVPSTTAARTCPACGSDDTEKLMSVPSTLSGSPGHHLPGPGDTACCGQQPHQADCAGPGSCCGRRTS